MDKIKKAIVTGATGFLGGALVEELLDNEYEVVKLNVSKLEYDDIYHDSDVLFHFAWAGVTDDYSISWDKQLENIRYSCELMEWAAGLGIKKFVYPGSIMEYEHGKAYYHGIHPLPARHYYHVAKHSARHLLRVHADQNNIAFFPLTISNVYGYRENCKGMLNRMINKTINRMINNEKSSFTAAEQKYDFIYINDAVRAIRLVAEQGKPYKEYYIGNRNQHQLKEFLFEAERILKPKHPLGIGEIEYEGVSLDYSEFDTNSLYEDFGFEPQISFAEGVAITAEKMMSAKKEHAF